MAQFACHSGWLILWKQAPLNSWLYVAVKHLQCFSERYWECSAQVALVSDNAGCVKLIQIKTTYLLACLFGHLILSIRFNLAFFHPDINTLGPLLGSRWSQWLAFKLLLQDASLCGSPHVQCTAGGEEEEEDEGYGKAHSVHHTSSQGTKTQFPQDLQSGQKTVVGGLNITDRERQI